ncbi:MAG: DRTGG domain-containing protein [Chloroflexota bacterium]
MQLNKYSQGNYYYSLLKGYRSFMILREIIHLASGKMLTDVEDLDIEVKGGYTADLMSDVLASIQPDAILLTGLCNPQVVRTAQMADIRAVIFAGGKQPTSDAIDLANEEKLPLISSPYGLYELSGRLFQSGLPSLKKI